jgi:truncated hemoglobin YjbI
MGGDKKLDEVVTAVYNDMRADKEIGKFFARFRLERLKDRTVDYLRGEWGGEAYKGSDLWISHSHMGINSHWYDVMMKYYVQRLKKSRIGKSEQQEILESLEKMRKPIVDPGLKLKDMYLKHSEREAAKVGGDGWGHVSNDPKERAKKEKETLDMLTKNRQAEQAKAAAATATPAEPAAPSSLPKKKAAPKKVRRETVVAKAAAESAECDVPGSVSDASTVAPASEAGVEATKVGASKISASPLPAAVTTLFDFLAESDSPPLQVPSSQPSGAELLYRLSVANKQ